MFKNLVTTLTQARTKRQWLKLGAYTLLVIGLVALAVITGSLLLRRAPYEFNQEQLTVAYLQSKTEVAGLKVVSDLSGFVQPEVAYIGYYSEDGVISEDELASGILVSEDLVVYQQVLDQFKENTPGCVYNQQKTRNQTEYLEATCQEASFELYTFKGTTGGIIIFTSEIGSDKLENILRNY